MRLVICICFTLVCHSAFCQSKIPVRQITNPQILEVLESYCNRLDSTDININHMIDLEFFELNTTDSLAVSSQHNEGHSVSTNDMSKILTKTYAVFSLLPSTSLYRHIQPTYYFYFRSRPIIVYTGAERLVEPNIKSIKKLERKLKKFSNYGVGFVGPYWIIKIKNNEIEYLNRN